jgi:hypothetical protein
MFLYIMSEVSEVGKQGEAMANAEQLAILKKGVKFWNKWREEHPKAKINLRKANLTRRKLEEANLSGVNLSESDLVEANLDRATLTKADLSGAQCVGASFRGADLRGADLAGAGLEFSNLADAKLQKANLEWARLWWTELTATNIAGTQFKESYFYYTILGNLDLSKARGLRNVFHIGPCTIGTNTIRLSKGKIPDKFLRGCGLSDLEIEQAKLSNPRLSNDDVTNILYRMYDLRATQAFQISPLFISYSHANVTFIDKLESHLNKKGIRFWRDVHDMKAGPMEKQIDKAIRENPTVLLVLSKHSLKSDWVEHEVRTARELEKELGRHVLCPVRLDNSWQDSKWEKRMMEQVTKYNILDFSTWRDDSKFDIEFGKLIDGLKLFYQE